MNNEDFLKLTDTVYNITEFVSDEPLKNKIRERALEVFSNLNLIFSKNPKATPQEKNKLSIQVEKDIEILENCLKLARSREYLYPFNFLIIKNEYDKIKEEVKQCECEEKEKLETPLETPSLPAPSVDVEKKTPGVEKRTPSIEKKTPDVGELSERQKKILKIFRRKSGDFLVSFFYFIISRRIILTSYSYLEFYFFTNLYSSTSIIGR